MELKGGLAKRRLPSMTTKNACSEGKEVHEIYTEGVVNVALSADNDKIIMADGVGREGLSWRFCTGGGGVFGTKISQNPHFPTTGSVCSPFTPLFLD